MPEKVDYHCTFNSGNYDQVFAKVISWEDNFLSHVESETGVWLEKEDTGANTLMCRNDEHLDGDNYVDDVKCSNTSSGNDHDTFYSFGKHNSLEGSWQTANTSIE